MRFLMHISLPAEKFNEALRDGSAGKKMTRILEEAKPEAAYFTSKDGKRGAISSSTFYMPRRFLV